MQAGPASEWTVQWHATRGSAANGEHCCVMLQVMCTRHGEPHCPMHSHAPDSVQPVHIGWICAGLCHDGASSAWLRSLSALVHSCARTAQVLPLPRKV